jgi:hypothetical protein
MENKEENFWWPLVRRVLWIAILIVITSLLITRTLHDVFQLSHVTFWNGYDIVMIGLGLKWILED